MGSALLELDPMAVATLLSEMEERLGVLIEDEDVEAEDLMSFGRLISLAERLSLPEPAACRHSCFCHETFNPCH